MFVPLKRWLVLILALVVFASPAFAQRQAERFRVDWTTGFLLQGSVAEASFIADFGQFGGQLIQRDQGTLSVDPAMWYGVQGTWRVSENLSLTGSWLHSRGRYRIQFPALASIEGDFDLEGLLLATLDFQSQQLGSAQAERAMSDALTDVYLASATWEFPSLDRWLFPYFRLGAGIFKQRSDGNVIRFQFEGPLPSTVEQTEGVEGVPVEAAWGLSVFSIDQTNPAFSIGGGFRASIGKQWGVDVQLESLTRFAVDMDYLGDASTPPPDPTAFRFYSTSFGRWDAEQGRYVVDTGTVNNFGFRVSLTYALWPYGAPR